MVLSTQEVLVRGHALRRLETIMQPVELSFVPTVSDGPQSLAAAGQPVIVEIEARDSGPGDPRNGCPRQDLHGAGTEGASTARLESQIRNWSTRLRYGAVPTGAGLAANRLADGRPVVFIVAYRVRLRRKHCGLGRTAKPALAGLLAVLLLVVGLLAADGTLHERLHYNGATGTNLCVVCLFAQGHVDAPDVAPALVLGALLVVCGLRAATAGVPWSFDFLLPPGRAPPCLSSV